MADPPRPFQLDPRLGGIPADVLQQRRDRPAWVTSPALERTFIQLGNLANPVGRPLDSAERAIVADILGGGVDAARVRTGETHLFNAPTTLGNQIRVPPGWTWIPDNKPVLVHEMTHVWQYQTRGTAYITDSIYHNASGQIATGNRNVAYMNYQLTPDCTFSEFSAEEQATIVGDYYELTRVYQDDANPPAWVRLRRPDLPIYERLMRTVRGATPRSEAVIYEQSLMNRPGPLDDFRGPNAPQFTPMVPLLEIRFR